MGLNREQQLENRSIKNFVKYQLRDQKGKYQINSMDLGDWWSNRKEMEIEVLKK